MILSSVSLPGFPYPKMSGMVKSQCTTRFQIAGGMSHFYILWLVVDLKSL